MEKKIYGLKIDLCDDNIYADAIYQMSDEEKQELINAYGAKHALDVYTLDGFFYYLNADMIDTENMYWVAV